MTPSPWKDVFPHGAETLFAREPDPGAICDIEIEGTCRYYRWIADVEADALYDAIGESRFEYLHNKLLIDNLPLSTFFRCKVIRHDRGAHAYQWRITFWSPGEQLGIAFANAHKGHAAERLGSLRVRVTPRPDIRAEQQVEDDAYRAKREREKAERAAEKTPADKAARRRERWLQTIARSSDDMVAILKRIHEGREQQIALLAAMNLDPESDTYNQYKSEIDIWTANQIVQFTEQNGAYNGPATLIG